MTIHNIRTQIGKHYQDICDRESYVTAEKVKNAYLGFGEKYRSLLEAFEKFTGDLKKRVGIDRRHGTWNRYYKSIDHLRTFMRKEYNVSDMPLASWNSRSSSNTTSTLNPIWGSSLRPSAVISMPYNTLSKSRSTTAGCLATFSSINIRLRIRNVVFNGR